jgi:predicted O-methyltransferase YrrM
MKSSPLGRMIVKTVDLLLAVLAFPSGVVLKIFRKRGGGKNFPLTLSVLKWLGVVPIIDHYYDPFYDSDRFPDNASETRSLPGIDFNVPQQLEFLRTLESSHELVAMKLDIAGKSVADFHFNNQRFERGDADFLYQFIRTIKPAKIVVIGSGYSTKIARLAQIRNRHESGLVTKHICVEPFEMKWLEELGDIEVVRSRVEVFDFDWTTELQAGDLLFIDSSHMIRPHGDVLKEYLDILPRLSPGVFIHVHDIFSPRDYPARWQQNMILWNEQYLLEVLLSNGTRYEVIAALNHLKHEHYDALLKVCPYLLAESEPGSIYIRTK